MDFSNIAKEIKDSNEEILIVADSDLDGKMALGLMKIILEKLNKKYMEYFRILFNFGGFDHKFPNLIIK